MTTTTYINVTLDDAPVDPARLEAWFRAYWDRHAGSDLGYDISGGDGALDVSGNTLALWVNSKYSIDGVQAIAEGMSGKYPTAIVELIEEWDDDEPGKERKVYQAGRRTVAQESALVPVNLNALVADVERALAKRGYERNTTPDVRAAAQALITALRA